MARIAGVDLPRNKRGEIGLTYIFGIGRQTARRILTDASIDFDKKVQEWSDEDLANIRNIVNNELKVEGALRSEVQLNIKRLMDIGCYRGIRHRVGLPITWTKPRTIAVPEKVKKKTVPNKKKSNQ